jgi:molybdate transport system ATP-binding protein
VATVTLRATIAADLGSLSLQVTLAAEAGEVVAVVGANGAGKTTLLRCLAGLVPGAALTLDGVDHSRSAPERRPIGVVFQDRLLFPHLSVLDNVGYGVSGDRRTRRRVAMTWLERFGLADRATTRPTALSGGQAQRVALARALAPDPSLLLLDEPLTALDPQTRTAIRRELHRHLEEFRGTAIVVSHDPLDAAALADRTIVLDDGRVSDRRAADVFGTNLLRGAAVAGVVTTATGATLVGTADVDGPAIAVVPRRAISLHRDTPTGSPRNVWAVVVERVEPGDDRVLVRVSGPIELAVEVTAASVTELDVRPGQTVWAAVKATEVDVVPI